MAGLDDMVCFSLYAASRATTQAYRRVLDPFGLTYPQYLVLVALWTGGTQSVRELGDALMLDSGTLSPLLRRLERQGLVERARSADDERVVEASLTARGEQLRTDMREVPGRIGSCMGLDLEAARELIDSLHALTRSLQEHIEASAS